MITQRKPLTLAIGVICANILYTPGDADRWASIVIANALTRPTVWTQSGPLLPQVNWGGRNLFQTHNDVVKFFAGVTYQLRSATAQGF